MMIIDTYPQWRILYITKLLFDIADLTASEYFWSDKSSAKLFRVLLAILGLGKLKRKIAAWTQEKLPKLSW